MDLYHEYIRPGMVGRHGRAEQDASAEPSGDRVGVSHGTRIEHGAAGLVSYKNVTGKGSSDINWVTD